MREPIHKIYIFSHMLPPRVKATDPASTYPSLSFYQPLTPERELKFLSATVSYKCHSWFSHHSQRWFNCLYHVHVCHRTWPDHANLTRFWRRGRTRRMWIIAIRMHQVNANFYRVANVDWVAMGNRELRGFELQ